MSPWRGASACPVRDPATGRPAACTALLVAAFAPPAVQTWAIPAAAAIAAIAAVAAALLVAARMTAKLRRSEADTRAILERAHDAYISMDPEGRIRDWNARAETIFGWPAEEAIGRDLAQTIIPDDLRERHRAGLRRFLATDAGAVVDRLLELEGLRRDGLRFAIELSISPVRHDGRWLFHAFVRDVEERRRAERYLAAQHAVIAVLAESATLEAAVPAILRTIGEGLGWQVGVFWTVDRRAGLLRAMARWQDRRAGAPRFAAATDQLTLPLGIGLPGRAWASGQAAWSEDVSEDESFPRQAAAVQDGLHAGLCLPIVSGGEVVGVIEFFARERRARDVRMLEVVAGIGAQLALFIDRLRRTERLNRLEEVARTDVLTGLPNRRAWEEHLPRELSRAARQGQPVCVAMIDLDDLKAYNDRHGHPAGDELLLRTAVAWQVALRASDVLARVGGDEFAAIFPACTLADGVALLERVREATPDGSTCSAGVAQWDGREGRESLVARADEALYAAKRRGRNRTIAAGVPEVQLREARGALREATRG
jgi:diguanylate cyclase (GGDEF)-like protein/PAS domain S-box-containing protein